MYSAFEMLKGVINSKNIFFEFIVQEIVIY